MHALSRPQKANQPTTRKAHEFIGDDCLLKFWQCNEAWYLTRRAQTDEKKQRSLLTPIANVGLTSGDR